MSTTAQLSENSHQGFEAAKRMLCLAAMRVKSNTASGMPVCLRRNGIGSRSTSKERDAETGLDYFGARYFSGAEGRFTSPDWSANAEPVPYARLDNPQTLNLYGYVLNNPLNRFDLDGHYEINPSGCSGKNQGKCQKSYDKASERLEQERQKKLRSKDPRIRAAAAAYGDPGKKNGVHISFMGLQSQGIKGRVDALSQSGNGKIDVEVIIDINLKGKSLQETIVHEGAHVADDLNFLNSYDSGTGHYDAKANFTGMQTEFNAYQAGAGVTSEHGFGPNDTQKIDKYIGDHYELNYLNNNYFPDNEKFPQ